MNIVNVLTIAGSDSGGGAGIQADLKTFSALGVYGCSVITALTAQNTRGVRGVEDVPAGFVAGQIDAVFEDIEIAAVKIGMLNRADVVAVVAGRLREHGARNIVLDPVMVAKSGDRLLRDDAVAALKEQLVPLAGLITPNLPEAAVLSGRPEPRSIADMEEMADVLMALGPAAVLVKGGHLGGADSPDILFDGMRTHLLAGERIASGNTHGTGCTLSAAIAALLGQGRPLPDAVRAAKTWLAGAIAAADVLNVGGGQGPVHHFHRLWRLHEGD